MKKTSLLTIVLLLLVVTLSAGTNRVGAQYFAWGSEETLTLSGISGSVEENGIGIILMSSYYPSSDSSLGIGFQIGATATHQRGINGASPTNTSDDPATWLAGITVQYSADLSNLLGLEVGGGILYEYQTDSSTSSGITTSVSISTLSFLGSANLLINLSDSFSLIGGLGLAVPLTTTYEINVGGISTSRDIEVTGSTIQAKVGVAFRL